MTHTAWTSDPKQNELPNVQHVIAISSGKGGVGKSTVSLNLASALKAQGAEVGLLDADIYGPSQPAMLGAQDEKPELCDKIFQPVLKHGLKTMSIGYLVDVKAPMMWRGPMLGKVLQQLLIDTNWGKLDYLIIDLPPGTGDIQLSLAQKIPLTGAVMITTPQAMSLLDVRKALEMWLKLSVPVLGIVENMSKYQCTHCGHEEALFGEGGGEMLAKEYSLPLLAKIFLDTRIREATDAGKFPALNLETYPCAKVYHQLADELRLRLSPKSKIRLPKIVVEPKNS